MFILYKYFNLFRSRKNLFYEILCRYFFYS